MRKFIIGRTPSLVRVRNHDPDLDHVPVQGRVVTQGVQDLDLHLAVVLAARVLMEKILIEVNGGLIQELVVLPERNLNLLQDLVVDKLGESLTIP